MFDTIFDTVFGLALVLVGLGTLIFRTQYIEWQKRMEARSGVSRFWNPTDRFREINVVKGSVGSIGFGLLILRLAVT